MDLAETLKEGLSSKTVFTVLGINVDEATVVTWIIMAVITLLCFLLTRNLRVTNISKRQAAVEYIVTKLEEIVGGMIGEHGRAYIPYLVTVLLYLGFANIIGVFGFKPPTKSLNVTASLAVMSIILVQYAVIRAKGVRGWLKGFKSPTPIVTPFNILDLVTRPLSLCMRLFGNILGAYIIMEIIKYVVPVIIPAALSLYFDFFDGILQAYVFVFLTSMYIKEALE
ncbi:MAG: F0F1 ATP synthase subunit A [Papillibacter sp.]|jgi:F-type H+-transporting ATPase subunit a|nr:F0F1 ATP synthase subunit A [Papillibacter sp.]